MPIPDPPLDRIISAWAEWTNVEPKKVELKSTTGDAIKPDTCSLENQDPSNCNCAAGVTPPVDGCGTGTIPTDFRKAIGTECEWSEQIR